MFRVVLEGFRVLGSKSQALSVFFCMGTVTRQEVQPQRLLHLLKQAVRYQVEFSRYHPKVVPSIPT